MKTNYIISSSLEGYNYTPNGLSCYVLNRSSLYIRVERLAASLAKKIVKYGGLDLNYLQNSSTLKTISRAARKELATYGERWTFEDDQQARRHLAAFIFETALAFIQ